MKQKRKSKNRYKISKTRLIVVSIGLVLVLIMAVANLVFMTNYPMGDMQTATAIVATNSQIMRNIELTETQAAMPTATEESP